MTNYKKTQTEAKLCYVVMKLSEDAVRRLPASDGIIAQLTLETLSDFISKYGIEELYADFKNKEVLH